MTGKRDAVSFKMRSPESKDDEGAPLLDEHGKTPTWFRGLLLCRRCDICGTRISIHVEGNDKVTMKCPECSREYVFFERSE